VPDQYMDQIEDTIRNRSLLKHPFYQAWSNGSLPIGSLERYAGQYYHFELAYPTFLSGLHHRCCDRGIRQLLLDNLWDEEHGEENHVELWLRFCEGLGIDRNEVQAAPQSEETAALVSTYRELTSEAPLAAGAAALYAYESQIPEVAAAKLQGLREFYGFEDDRSVSFFTVHKTLDEKHSQAEREMVLTLASTPEDRDAVTQAVDRATEALWRFLDGVY
jgi:pyrroloquinoline-quinone synthase